MFDNLIDSSAKSENTLFFPMVITLYEFSAKEIKKTINAPDFDWEKFDEFSPQYIVDTERIVESVYVFEDDIFQETNDDELFLMFDIEYYHPLLEYEIQEVGIEDFFDYCQNSLPQLLRVLPQNNMEMHEKKGWRTFPDPIIIMVYMKHYSHYDHYSGGYEGELDVAIEGYLDKQNNFIKYDDIFKNTSEQNPS
jgi:hypothetical protein